MTWDDLSQRIEAEGIDLEEPSLQEICDIVKGVRKSRELEVNAPSFRCQRLDLRIAIHAPDDLM
ncbi:MAG: hypothetical protein DCF20_21040 [Pseudanabaena sp.]|nr:MAG: hypothetical protein DCF20_21040 [Pseudanabaena sp.]